MNEDNGTWLLDSIEEEEGEKGEEKEEKKESKNKEEEKEKPIDEYDELRKILRTVRPKDEKINAIVTMMGYVSLDNLEALRDYLRLAGWRVNDIALAIKLWGYRRGLVGTDADTVIDDLIVRGLEKETKEKSEEKVEEELEKEEKKLDETVDRLYLQQIRAKAREERLKALGIGAGATKKEEKEKEEDEKITHVIDGIPLKLTRDEYIAIKRWEKEKRLEEERLKREEKTEKKDVDKIPWTFRDGTVREVPLSALPLAITNDALMAELREIKERDRERDKEEEEEESIITVNFPDGRKMSILKDYYPFIQEIERERELRDEMRKEVQELREELRNINPWEYVKSQMEVMKEFGWSPRQTGRTEWDVLGQTLSDVHDSITMLGSKLLDKVEIESEEYRPFQKYSPEERRKKIEALTKKTGAAKKMLEIENKILSA